MMAVRDVMHTSNPIYNYEFSWIINNFSTVPHVLRGPPISQVPGFCKKLCFELNISGPNKTMQDTMYTTGLTLNLVDLDGDETCRLTSHKTTFGNTNGDVIIESTVSNIDFNTKIILMTDSCITFTPDRVALSKRMSLADDKLVVKGSLSFSAYGIASTVSSRLVSPDDCGELLRDFKTMYESGSSSDFTFSFGKRTLRAHKIILRSRSPVFASMFDSDMLESNSNKVAIEDADYQVFNCFLVFLYTGIVEDKTWDTVLGLYHLADKYQVKSLHAVCSGILGNNLTTDSFCSVLELSDLHGDHELKEVAKVFFRRYWLHIVGTAEWAKIINTKPRLVDEVVSETNSAFMRN